MSVDLQDTGKTSWGYSGLQAEWLQVNEVILLQGEK